MKTLQKALIATTLTLALSATAFAGDISGGRNRTGDISGSQVTTQGDISGSFPSVTSYVVWVFTSTLY
ncbi:MAG TPA: hypothetical protein VIW80_06535 [Pyrinomonadaceae bacterium]|jgi:hypothetical protein